MNNLQVSPTRSTLLAMPGAVACLRLLLLGCMCLLPAAGQAESILSRLFGHGDSMRVEMNTPHHNFTLRVRGSLTVNPAEDDIETITNWAFIEERKEGLKRSMVFKLEKDGSIARTYSINEKTHPIDDEAKRWLAALLPRVLRESGLYREARIDRLLAKGGQEAVLEEINRIQGGHARRQYVQSLVDRGPLSEKMLTQLLTVIAGINGDYEKRQAFSRLVTKQNLGPKEQAAVLAQVARMESSHDQRSLLSALAPRLGSDPAVQAGWQAALKSMDSDFERKEATVSLVRKDPANINLALQSVRLIESDFECASALSAISRQLGTPTSAQVAAYTDAVQSIESDFERRNALESLIRRATLDKQGFERVLKATRGMKSDHEIRNLLVAVARRMPADPALIATYREIGRKLNDHERGEVEKALDRLQP